MRLLLLVVVAIALGLASGRARAAEAVPPESKPFSFTSRAEPSEVKLGERFRIEVEVKHDASEQYRLPAALDLGPVTERGAPQSDRKESGGTAITTFSIPAAVFDQLGEVQVPDLKLEVVTGEGPRVLTVPGPPVKVGETYAGEELEDIRPPQELRIPDYGILLAALAGAVVAGLLFMAIQRWRKRRGQVPAAPPVPADQRALAALGQLDAEKLPDQGRGREHHFRLSEILRGYLQEAYGIAALDMTSSELVAALERRDTPGLQVGALAAWIARGDLVRFARGEVNPADAAKDLTEAQGMVRSVALALRIEEERRAAEATRREEKGLPPNRRKPQPPRDERAAGGS